MGIKMITCSERTCKNKISGKGTFESVAEKEGWKLITKNVINYFVCPECSAGMKDTPVKFDPEETPKETKSIMDNLKSDVLGKKKK